MITKSLIQPFVITLTALIITFMFFVFGQYYQPIFATRIFCLDTAGLLLVSTLYYFFQPKVKSIIKRSLLIVFIYFACYEILDTVIYFAKHHCINRSRTDFVEAETAVITFTITFLIAGLVKLNRSIPAV
jgi:hypothetical protein